MIRLHVFRLPLVVCISHCGFPGLFFYVPFIVSSRRCESSISSWPALWVSGFLAFLGFVSCLLTGDTHSLLAFGQRGREERQMKEREKETNRASINCN